MLVPIIMGSKADEAQVLIDFCRQVKAETGRTIKQFHSDGGLEFLNSTLQGAYFIMAARALGLDTGPMTGFSNEAVDAAFFADQPNHKSVMLSTLGYGDPASIFGRSAAITTGIGVRAVGAS